MSTLLMSKQLLRMTEVSQVKFPPKYTVLHFKNVLHFNDKVYFPVRTGKMEGNQKSNVAAMVLM